MKIRCYRAAGKSKSVKSIKLENVRRGKGRGGPNPRTPHCPAKSYQLTAESLEEGLKVFERMEATVRNILTAMLK